MINSAPPTSNPSPTAAWVYLIASLLYLLSPIDLLPDILIIGDIDDALLMLISTLNLAQAYLARVDQLLAMIGKTLEIGVIGACVTRNRDSADCRHGCIPRIRLRAVYYPILQTYMDNRCT